MEIVSSSTPKTSMSSRAASVSSISLDARELVGLANPNIAADTP